MGGALSHVATRLSAAACQNFQTMLSSPPARIPDALLTIVVPVLSKATPPGPRRIALQALRACGACTVLIDDDSTDVTVARARQYADP